MRRCRSRRPGQSEVVLYARVPARLCPLLCPLFSRFVKRIAAASFEKLKWQIFRCTSECSRFTSAGRFSALSLMQYSRIAGDTIGDARRFYVLIRIFPCARQSSHLFCGFVSPVLECCMSASTREARTFRFHYIRDNRTYNVRST